MSTFFILCILSNSNDLYYFRLLEKNIFLRSTYFTMKKGDEHCGGGWWGLNPFQCSAYTKAELFSKVAY